MKALSVLLSGPAFDNARLTIAGLRVGQWLRVARERRRLGELDAHMLADIGLTREAVDAELSRPFWDIDRRV